MTLLVPAEVATRDPDHGVHRWAIRQLDRLPVIGIAVSQVQVAGSFVGCLQVGRGAMNPGEHPAGHRPMG